MAEGNGILANPAPLGLMGFGMTTVLLNLHNAGIFALGSMILAMGIFYGGFAQIIAGILEYKRGDTFGVTAFNSFGLFWLSLVGLVILPNIIPGFNWPEGTAVAMGSYFFMWGLFTFMMFISTLKKPKALQFVFLSLVILFWLLALGEFTGYTTIGIIAGYEGIICGLSAMYLAIAEVTNETFKKIILPVGGPTIK